MIVLTHEEVIFITKQLNRSAEAITKALGNSFTKTYTTDSELIEFALTRDKLKRLAYLLSTSYPGEEIRILKD
jgi:hypothetical protein